MDKDEDRPVRGKAKVKRELGKQPVRRNTKKVAGRSTINPDGIIALGETHFTTARAVKDMVHYLPEDIRSAILKHEFTRGTLSDMERAQQHVGSGIWSVFPMVCTGSECPYRGRCPLEIGQVPPLGYDCPLESYLIDKWMVEYMKSLNVYSENKAELDQVGTIVMCDLILMRIRNFMSRRPDGHIDESAIGIDNNGNVILKREISKEILIEEKYAKIKSKLLEELLATRESRAKYDVVDDNDPSVKAAKLRMRAQEVKSTLQARAEVKSEKLLQKAEFYESIAGDIEDITSSLVESSTDREDIYSDDSTAQ